jgi:Arc-like DNA binding domain
MARKPADKVGIVVRFSEALRRRIEKAAKARNRSMNAEIVERLEASFRNEDRQGEMEAMAERAAERAGEKAIATNHEWQTQALVKAGEDTQSVIREMLDRKFDEFRKELGRETGEDK